jgi:hypothetical protein
MEEEIQKVRKKYLGQIRQLEEESTITFEGQLKKSKEGVLKSKIY